MADNPGRHLAKHNQTARRPRVIHVGHALSRPSLLVGIVSKMGEAPAGPAVSMRASRPGLGAGAVSRAELCERVNARGRGLVFVETSRRIEIVDARALLSWKARGNQDVSRHPREKPRP